MQDRLKVLCFHPALAPYRVDFFNSLASLFDTELVLLGRNLEEQKFDQDRLVERLKCRVSYLTKGFMFRGRYIRTGFLGKIREVHPDVVLGYEYSPITVIVLLYRWLLRKRFRVVTMTDDTLEQTNAVRGLRKFLRTLVMKFADGIIVTNNETADWFERHGVTTAVSPIVYEEESFRRNEKAIFEAAAKLRGKILGAHGTNRLIIFVGRLEPVKNLHWLLGHIAEILTDNDRFVLVGNGTEEVSLKQLVEQSGNLKDHVFFAGRFEGDALMPYFAAADLLILPSVSETFGAVVSEALLWGAACAVSSHVGAKSLIDGKNGLVFEYEKEGDFKDKVSAFLSQLPRWEGLRASRLYVDYAQMKKSLQNLLEG